MSPPYAAAMPGSSESCHVLAVQSQASLSLPAGNG